MNLITSMSLSWMFWKMFCFAKTIKLLVHNEPLHPYFARLHRAWIILEAAFHLQWSLSRRSGITVGRKALYYLLLSEIIIEDLEWLPYRVAESITQRQSINTSKAKWKGRRSLQCSSIVKWT